MVTPFEEAYKKLNEAQRDSVDTIEGPVMVIAGPGTGKTEVLALRIANILTKTDTPASGILCLTFTRSGVTAMRKRLEKYIGTRANDVRITTFHSYAIELIEEHYLDLDFIHVPSLLDDKESVFLVDELLHSRAWKHLRPRVKPETYFNDLKSLISLLKRERISPIDFRVQIEREIESLEKNPDNISSRGETKGQIKKEISKKIEALERTGEVVEFYEAYEAEKQKKLLMDYDDVLEYAVKLVEGSDDVCADIRESALYVLVDEHQDSSGVQNNFLKAVWDSVEKPNIFVVGDDRQLIYGFGGASLSYFEEFKTAFGKAELITLVENYRSTAPILSLADTLLSSELTNEKLRSNRTDSHELYLSEYSYSRDEIIGAGLYFKRLIKDGVDPRECALLVPKNYHVRSALVSLRNMGLAVSMGDSASFFDSRTVLSFRKVLKVVLNPNDSVALANTLLNDISGVSALSVHRFLRDKKNKNFSIENLLNSKESFGLFEDQDQIYQWGKKLELYINESTKLGLLSLLSLIGNDLLIKKSDSHERLLENSEALRTVFHLAEIQIQKNPHVTLGEFLDYLERLESYKMHIPLATFGAHKGVSVMTLHRSKGLEFEAVWIAHMNEETLMSQKKGGFTLPESVKEKIEEKDKSVARREVYVAITRAKKHCTISYAKSDARGGEMELAEVIRELPDMHFVKKDATETEEELLVEGPDVYVRSERVPEGDDFEKMKTLVTDEYEGVNVSVSLLNNFFECPWKWYFRNFLKLPEIKSDSLALGSAVHSAIEMVLKASKIPSESDIRQCVETSFEREGLSDDRTLEKLTKDAVEIVLAWIKTSYKDLAPSRESERSISFKDSRFPNLNMYGKIDLTEKFADGAVSVTDFKTGSSKTSGVIEKLDEENRLSTYMRQLAMYSYLVRGSDKKEVASSKLYFLESKVGDKNRIYATRIGDEQIDLLVRDIEDYNRLLKTGEWTDRTCNAKMYGGGDECEQCKLARDIYKEEIKNKLQ